jgi:hypothetical protein
MNITIKPYYCPEGVIFGSVKKPLEKIRLMIKSLKFATFRSGSMKIINLIFDGIDMAYHKRNPNENLTSERL